MGEALVGRPYKFFESSLSVAQIPKRKIMYNNIKDLVGSITQRITLKLVNSAIFIVTLSCIRPNSFTK